MQTIVCRFLVFCLLLVSLGCASSKESMPVPRKEKALDEYLIGPEDVLEISVWQNQDLTRTVAVRPDGMISIPLVGDIQAASLTPDQLKEAIAQNLKPFMDDPLVAVIVQEINSWRIYMQGEVRSPGVYPIRSHITISQAITLAGGFTEYAKESKIRVVRPRKNYTEIIKVNYNKIVSGKGVQEDVVLIPGDTVIVP